MQRRINVPFYPINSKPHLEELKIEKIEKEKKKKHQRINASTHQHINASQKEIKK
jgi:hypothetical protein